MIYLWIAVVAQQLVLVWPRQYANDRPGSQDYSTYMNNVLTRGINIINR
jgi:hypothetical protein